MTSELNTTVLYADYTTRLSYYDDWLEAFLGSHRLCISSHNICDVEHLRAVASRIRSADVVVLLHSTNGDTTMYLEPWVPVLQERRGLVLTFVGNEVNLPGSPISAKRGIFEKIQPDYIATQLLAEAGQHLFGDLARNGVISVPHALNPNAFRPAKPLLERRLDIGVRAARYLPHLGDEDRNRIHEYFTDNAAEFGLSVDVGTQRLSRADWAAFLNDCKGTVSTEAGSWFLERDDRTVETIRGWTAERMPRGTLVIANDSPFRRLGHRLPWPVRAALRKLMAFGPVRHESTITETLDFDEVFERFFRRYPRPSFYGKCISSRHFDAIGTKTCQIMFPGRFNDILLADEHYLALKPDFSNITSVLERFRDAAERQRLVSAAHDHVLAAHTYAHRVDALVKILFEGSSSASRDSQAQNSCAG